MCEMTVGYPRRVGEVKVMVKTIMYRGCRLGGGDTVRAEREDRVGEGTGVESPAGEEGVKLRAG